jgi:glycosyltransferase XagB
MIDAQELPPPLAPPSRRSKGFKPPLAPPRSRSKELPATFATQLVRVKSLAPPRLPNASAITNEELLRVSIDGLRNADPDDSASKNLTTQQRFGVAVGAVLAIAVFAARPLGTAVAFVALSMLVYVIVLSYRTVLFITSLKANSMITVSDDEARAVADDDLPIYTVLVPAYKEPEVIADLTAAIARFEYPARKLDVKLLLEDDDAETIAAAMGAQKGDFQIVRVPAAEPRTKPKALNFGLQLARGSLVTVYDAEDHPDPLQLRRAAIALTRGPAELACVQARLAYHNVNQNIITRWFTLEYATWFTQFLPGLVARNAPVPLGGTSNHFKKSVLDEIGAWDPFNVTEDADLGMRLHRRGYRTGVLDSVTLEEANSDFINWVKQRSRWYKGYIQTWAVHLRHPVKLWRELGPKGFAEFNLFVGGTPLLALLNPVFWLLAAFWFIAEPAFVQAIFPHYVYYLALICWLVGNFALVFMNILMAHQLRHKGLHRAAALTPLYWVMMSLAAVKAAVQFVFQPSSWEKTVHGLGTRHVFNEIPIA